MNPSPNPAVSYLFHGQRKIPDTISDVELPLKRHRLAAAYLWSMVIWLGFTPFLAGQDKVRLLHRGIDTPYWNLLLDNGAWLFTAAVFTPPIFFAVRRYPVERAGQVQRISVYVLIAVPYILGAAALHWLILPPYNSATHRFEPRTMAGFIRGTYIFADLIWDYLVILVAAHAYRYFKRTRDQEIERAELQQALAASELQALKSQLRPHFLFNTMHGISTLIETDQALAKEMILRLSNLLRTALKFGNADLVTLEDELKFAEGYLDIEKMRLGERLEVQWKIQPETLPLQVPQLILQPLVENAIVHGIACSRSGGWVEISSRAAEGRLELKIRNSVRGSHPPGFGVGLRNTGVRLKHLYEEEANLCFSTDENGIAMAVVTLPSFAPRERETSEAAALPSAAGAT